MAYTTLDTIPGQSPVLPKSGILYYIILFLIQFIL